MHNSYATLTFMPLKIVNDYETPKFNEHAQQN